MAKAGNLKLDFMAKRIGIRLFGFEDIFRCYRDNENLKHFFGRMDTLTVLVRINVPWIRLNGPLKIEGMETNNVRSC